MQQMTLEEARTRLEELIDAALRGETVSIARDDQQAVQLVPITAQRRPGRFGSARGLIQMADDFDAPLPEFDEYSP